MKYIIAIVVVVVGNAILLSISYNLGALLTAILSGGLVVWGFNYVGLFGKKKDAKWLKDKVKFKKTKNTKVEEEVEEVEEEEIEEELDKIEEELKEVEEEKGWGFIHYFIGFVVVAILFNYLFDADFGKIIEILKLLDSLVIEFFRGIQQIFN